MAHTRPTLAETRVQKSAYIYVKRTGEIRLLMQYQTPVQNEVCVPIELDIADRLFDPPELPVVQIEVNQRVLPAMNVISESVDELQRAGVRVRIVGKMEGNDGG